jgi:hypothetical protein
MRLSHGPFRKIKILIWNGPGFLPTTSGSPSRPGLAAPEQPADPQREQEPEPGVRIGQRVAEQLADLS